MGEPIHKKYPDVMSGISKTYDIVSVDHILKSGWADIYSSEIMKGTKVDLTTNSAGKRVITGMMEKAATRIAESEGLQALLKKPVWNQVDRQQWEASISDIARDVIAEEPIFGKYRNDPKKASNTPLADITRETNFHCEPMAILTGIMVQTMENQHVPETSPEDSYKRRQSYYFGGGLLNRAPRNNGPKPKEYEEKLNSSGLRHGYIISPMSGNVIEGTQGRPDGWQGHAESTYQIAPDGFTFDHYVAGFPILSHHGLDYTYGYAGDEKSKQLAQSRFEAVGRGDFAYLQGHRATDQEVAGQYKFLNERSILRQFHVNENSIMLLEASDAHIFANRRASELVKGPGRSYDELLKASREPDFSMSELELERATAGNRLILWGLNNPAELKLIEGKRNEQFTATAWQDKPLTDYLISQGVENVWLFKPLAKGQNFADAARATFDQLPVEAKMIAGKNGEKEPMKFEDYLAVCRDRLKTENPAALNENQPGLMVPVLMNPASAVEEFKERAGRSTADYYKQDVSAATKTEVSVYDRSGTKNDTIQFSKLGIYNGITTIDTTDAQKVRIEDPVAPLKTPAKPVSAPGKSGASIAG
mgnify:FL=1